MRWQAVLLLGAAALLAGPVATAHGAVEGQVGPTPLCEVTANTLSCLALWYHADAEAGLMCLVATDPTWACVETVCTLDHPPSRCGNAFARWGFRG